MNKNNFLGVLLIVLTVGCQQTKPLKTVKVDHSKNWVDSVYKTMSLKEKVGQLFMVAAYSNRDAKHLNDLKVLVKDYAIGGLCFFQGGPVRQVLMTNNLQADSKIPMLVGIDAEWGLKMRLDSTIRFPYNMTLGAISNNKLIQQLGKQQGENCNRMGIHVNFAPVVDINTNPKNPIIGVRSYGEHRQLVTDKAMAFVQGMEATGVMACVKHFPGHGDTHTDSHKTLPTIGFTAKRIDSVELYPFKKLFNYGVGSVMVAHLNVPSLEKQEGLPSSLSYAIVTDLLQKKLKYDGLIFTDALNMKGAANFKQPGDIDLAAFLAGNDVLLFSESPEKGISLIVKAYENRKISEVRLAYSVKKILRSKFNVGLAKYAPILIDNLVEDLNNISNTEINNRLSDNAITVLKNEIGNIPFIKGNSDKIAYVKFGNGNSQVFSNGLVTLLNVDEVSEKNSTVLLRRLKAYDKVIISYHRKNYRLTNKISKSTAYLIQKIAANNKVIFVSFSSLYTIRDFSFSNFETVIVAYENSAHFQKSTLQVLSGDKRSNGTLPATINTEFFFGNGITYRSEE